MQFACELATFVLILNCLSGALRIPKDMWEVGTLPKSVPQLDAEQAIKVNQLDENGKELVLRDLTRKSGGVDMDDEFEIPLTVHLSILSPADDNQSGTSEEDNQTGEPTDRILQQVEWEPRETSRLLFETYGYGTYGTYGTLNTYGSYGLAVPVVQAKTYVPVVVPVVQQPVVKLPQAIMVAVQPQQPQQLALVQEQQTTITGMAQQQQLQQPMFSGQQATGQGRMALPTTGAQSQLPAVQPQQFPTGQAQLPTAVQPQVPAVQPDFAGQGRMALPTGETVNPQPTDQTQTMQQPQQQQQQPQLATITVKHQIAPQHIHIVIPKSKQSKRKGYYYYY